MAMQCKTYQTSGKTVVVLPVCHLPVWGSKQRTADEKSKSLLFPGAGGVVQINGAYDRLPKHIGRLEAY